MICLIIICEFDNVICFVIFIFNILGFILLLLMIFFICFGNLGLLSWFGDIFIENLIGFFNSFLFFFKLIYVLLIIYFLSLFKNFFFLVKIIISGG